MIGVLILGGTTTLSCDENDHTATFPNSVCDQTTINDAAMFNAASFANVDITQMSLNANCLHISYGSSGCDGSSWIVKLITDGTTDYTTTPATKKLKFVLQSSEACTAAFSKQKSFDVSSLQIPGSHSVQLKLVNTNQAITYFY